MGTLLHVRAAARAFVQPWWLRADWGNAVSPYPRPLSAGFVKTVREPGKYYDGRGSTLYLRVSRSGRKYWECRYTFDSRRRTRGLRTYPDVTLKDARSEARKIYDIARKGQDPLASSSGSTVPKFRDAVESALQVRRVRWSNPVIREKVWRSTFDRYVNPIIGSMPVSAITSADVLRVLGPVHQAYPKQLSVVRERTGVVFNWAIAHGFRTTNPAAAEVISQVFGPPPRRYASPCPPSCPSR